MNFENYYIALMAMLPVAELRGAIPLGVALGVPLKKTLLLSVVGNLVVVPILLLGIEWIIAHFKRLTFLRNALERYESRAASKVSHYRKYRLMGLYLLVAVPLPGTGVYTACLAARLFKINLMNAWVAISAGVLSAGLLVTLITVGVVHFG